jgi:delta-aminolevulinic acid dehydratase/porphobilinogen synthase
MFRPRRLPEKRLLRRMVRETTDDLVCCLFAVHGRGTACAS